MLLIALNVQECDTKPADGGEVAGSQKRKRCMDEKSRDGLWGECVG